MKSQNQAYYRRRHNGKVDPLKKPEGPTPYDDRPVTDLGAGGRWVDRFPGCE